jgi:iron complex outermembrane receptor protein
MAVRFACRTWSPFVLALACVAAPSVASHAQQRDTARLPRVLVTVTRDAGRSTYDLPYAITVVSPDSARPGQRHLTIDELLSMLPGVMVANRYNPAQDPRVSIRGFGARSTFGVRGVRVMRDGIPLTLADGQTPLDYLDLESVGSVQVIRGSASALYGNAAGGVIELRSVAPPEDRIVVQARGSNGSFDTQRWTGMAAGTAGGFGYQGSATRTQVEGFRENARQRTTSAFGRLLGRAAGTEVALHGLFFDQPEALNPGALTAGQLAADPRQADSLSVRRRARKVVRQSQLGLTASRPFGDAGEVTATVYGGSRSLDNPLTFAVVSVERTSYGASLRGTVPASLASLAMRLSAGVDVQRQNDDRHEWENCNEIPARTTATATCPIVGAERGALRKSQRELVSSIGPFVRAELELPARVWLSAGVRADYVRFEVDDRLVTATNPDDSGDRTLHAVSPMLGATWRVAPLVAVYATISSAFETPTATELGNKPDGSAGINPTLDPQFARTYEAGVKGVLLSRVRYDVAAFTTTVRDELIPFQIPGGAGRIYFRNAGRTERRGAELGLGAAVGDLQLTAACSYSHFRFADFTVGSTSFAGDRIPGVPERQVQAAATWRAPGGALYATLEGIASSYQFVNDTNTARAAGYAIANVRLGGTATLGRSSVAPVVGVHNLFDQHLVSSVSVNATGGKYYEPAPGRIVFVGLTLAAGR